MATEYQDEVGWLWIQAYAHSLVRNPHNNRRDVLRVLRTSHRIMDLFDPVPNTIENTGLTQRLVARNLRKLFDRKAELARISP